MSSSSGNEAAPAQTPLDYTGERYDPEAANALAEYDHAGRYHFVRQLVGRGAGSALLDLGCGLGVGTRFLAPLFQRVVGVDVSTEALEEARKRTSDSHVSFVALKNFSTEPQPELFDVVTCLEVIEHTLEQDRLVRMVRERLRQGGVAIFSTPNILHTRAQGIHNPFHVKELTREEFLAVLQPHFAHLQLFAQVQVNGAMVVTEEAAETPVVGGTILASTGRGTNTRFASDVVTNYVAVCSQHPRPLADGVSFLDARSTYVEELKEIIRQQARLVDARDEALRAQAQLIDSRDEALRAQTQLIDSRDEALRAQTQLIDSRDEALRTQAQLIDSRDEALRAQAQLIDSRDETLRTQARVINSRDEALAAYAARVEECTRQVSELQARLKDAEARLVRMRYKIADGVNHLLVRISPELTQRLRRGLLWANTLRRSGRDPIR
jgi:2-polyprenyl-3-methyl-5-hydroxy-6-metoxy-1,4-benzoquinol methylase